MAKTLFDLPVTPDEFGVTLPQSNLRKIDFSGLDFEAARRAIIEYIQTYYPDQFNDFVASNGIIMLTEIVASVVAKLSLRSDLLAQESTLPTCKTEEAVVNHLALIGQKIRRQTPATVDFEVTIEQPLVSDLEIPAGTQFSISGANGTAIVYEVYKSPEDWTSNIIIPAGKRGVIAFGLEGQFAEPITAISTGAANQTLTIENSDILEKPIFVTVTVGDSVESWRVVTDPIQKFLPNDKVAEVRFFGDEFILQFGDNVNGKIPPSGSTIEVRYRIGGGIRGRIGVNQIDITQQFLPLPPANAGVGVRFRNISPSSGGSDRESLEEAKFRAPRDFSLQRSIVTGSDYTQAAKSYSHPVFGNIAKAIATIKTSLNANLVELYVLTEGSDGFPALPSAGLKTGLTSYLSELNVLTDQISVLDGALYPVDIDMAVIVNKNADATVVKEQVENIITSYFKLSNWELGKPFYLSNFVEKIEAVDGVAYVDVYKPVNNVQFTGKKSDEDSSGIGFDAIIVAGSRKTEYFYEKDVRSL